MVHVTGITTGITKMDLTASTQIEDTAMTHIFRKCGINIRNTLNNRSLGVMAEVCIQG